MLVTLQFVTCKHGQQLPFVICNEDSYFIVMVTCWCVK